MTKSEFIKKVAEEAEGNAAESKKYIEAALKVIENNISEKITLTGFGTFYLKERKERAGRNPRTGAPLTIAAAKIPSFKAGKQLKEKYN